MDKIRLLACSDDSRTATGFARVVREVLIRLQESGRYEVMQHGWFSNCVLHNVPYPVIPTSGSQTARKPDGSVVFGPEDDTFGQKTFSTIVADFKPHIVWGVGNVDMLVAPVTSPIRETYRLVCYAPIDSFPILHTNIIEKMCSAMDRFVMYTEWGKNLLIRSTNVVPTDVIPHGVSENFFPEPDTAACKAKKEKPQKTK